MRTGARCRSVRSGASLPDAIVEMSGKGMGMTAIVDADGRVVGVFTDGDLRRAVAGGRDVASIRVDDVMTRTPRTVDAARLAVDCVELMETRAEGVAAPRRRRARGGSSARSTCTTSSARADRMSDVAAAVPPAPGRSTRSSWRARAPCASASFDVDGVLTDGRIYVDDDGRETKAFHALDGVGMKRLAAAGIAVAWITGSASPSVEHRARALGIAHLVRGTEDKLPAWKRLRASLGLAARRSARTSGTTCPTSRCSRPAASRRASRTRPTTCGATRTTSPAAAAAAAPDASSPSSSSRRRVSGTATDDRSGP